MHNMHDLEGEANEGEEDAGTSDKCNGSVSRAVKQRPRQVVQSASRLRT